jgi:hypothetical protein
MQNTQNLLLPFDSYCPSIQGKLHSRICSICKQYIPSPTRLRNHYRVHQQRYASNSIDYKYNKEEEELIDEQDPIDPNDINVFQINPSYSGVFLFSDTIEWLKSDFEADPVVETKPKSSVTIANAMIRKEKQLQEAAAAAIGISSINAFPPTTDVQSSATISVDNALTTTNENICLTEIKIENEIENENVTNAMEQLVVNDSLNQYDDLTDLIDQI